MLTERPELSANIGILWSEGTRRVNAEEAQNAGAVYEFEDAWGRSKSWLKGQYAYLAPSTVSAALNRFNLKHDFIDDEGLADRLSDISLLFLPSAHSLAPAAIDAIGRWLDEDDAFLCVTGPTNLPKELLGLEKLSLAQTTGYTAWQWRSNSPFGDRAKWEEWYISGYKGFTTCVAEARADSTVLANLQEVGGDLSGSDSAAVRRVGAGIVQTEKSLFVANALFEHMGGVWQAHLNAEEIRRWFNPFNWAETLLYQLREVLWSCGQERFWNSRLRTFGSYDGVMNIRHDPDKSVDMTMLRYQEEHLIPATHTLLDANISPEATTTEMDQQWVREISKNEFIEIGLHNDAIQETPPKWMMGANLARHVIESEKNLGVRLYTGGRHGGYSVYPEMIDAMDYLYQTVPHFLGLGTFHFHLMAEYGDRTPNPQMGDMVVTYQTLTSPTIASPGFWFPFHGVVSTSEECRQLRGWDITHEYDPPPEVIDAVYERPNSKDQDPETALGDGVYQLQYHPLFTVDPSYNHGRGTFDWMCYSIRRAERLNLWQATQRAIYERMQDYEDVQFRVTDGGRTIQAHNPTGRAIEELMVESAIPVGAPEQAGPDALGAGAVADESEAAPEVEYASLRLDTCQESGEGARYLAHIVGNRFFTLPRLEPGASCTVRLEGGGARHPFVAQANSKSTRFFDVSFETASGELTIRAYFIRYQGMVVQGYAPGDRVSVEVDGVARQPLVSEDGRLLLYLQGPENHFDEKTIVLRKLQRK
ncbi:MAG: hypothetical protein F4047_16825 [Caldilineaceae bacterium SB0670_bin_27]|uniref:Uncharacterized protein n=1 Tax=Caldilineaceae bacterium SB0664_bin_27 TaxID=2605260 RepID=A0A6B0YR36_9CHLR|nr:hypothetical protein [Caldilineaceae bacterium SB0664_bin_27]MYJ79764.1 hypothetical protein [Caldilineaceae bacterium SB0670_bin_27]